MDRFFRLNSDDIEPASPKAIPLSCLCTQFKWKIFPLFCVRFLAPKRIIFSSCEKALTPICRRLLGRVARIGGRVRMGHTKARRNLDAAGRAEQAGPSPALSQPSVAGKHRLRLVAATERTQSAKCTIVLLTFIIQL